MKCKPFLTSLFFALATCAQAETLSPLARQEIGHLFLSERSGCEFQRNGTWHTALEASAHLRMKYDYLERHDLLSSAEDFIAGAASVSSRSKQAYLVRCPQSPTVESRVWFYAGARTLPAIARTLV